MSHLILSCSLSPASRSARLASQLLSSWRDAGETAELIDLRTLDLPFCDDDRCYGHPQVQRLAERIRAARSLVFATPIYNYEVGGATRNVVALVGSALDGKLVGFLCAAGGQRSYMSVMGFASSLMLDFRCWIVPRFVYADSRTFDDAGRVALEVRERIDELGRELSRASRLVPSAETVAPAL